MSVKPDTPITRKEMYLDVATGGSSTLPEPVTIEEKYLAKIAGMAVDLPAPVPLKHKFLAKIAGMQVDVPTYTAGLPRIYAYLAKAAGQDVDVPQPITREEMYWYDYVSGQPTPSEQEYTGAVPVTFTANGQPLLDYLISGNTVQSGTPTPDSPVMPQGTGERSAQLIPYPFYSSDGEYAGVQFTTDNGRIIANGTLTSGLLYYLWRPANFQAGTYTMSVKGKHSGAAIYFRDMTHNVSVAPIYSAQEGDRSVTFTVTEEISAMVYINAGSGTLDFDCTIMLNSGSTALPYEPYGYKLDISCGDTVTPIYLGEVPTTRKIRKLVLTGEETNWLVNSTLANSNAYYCIVSGYYRYSGFCTHYATVDNARAAEGVFFGTNINFLTALSDNIDTVDKWKNYLRQQYAAGTPVTVWYVLASETTGIVNEPLMKIGDYADTLSMEQAGVSVPTVAGSNTLDVLTEVKPSEVYIKYKGEPVPQLSMLSSPGTNAPEELSEEAEEIPEEEVPEEFPEEKEEETESITPETEE